MRAAWLGSTSARSTPGVYSACEGVFIFLGVRPGAAATAHVSQKHVLGNRQACHVSGRVEKVERERLCVWPTAPQPQACKLCGDCALAVSTGCGPPCPRLRAAPPPQPGPAREPPLPLPLAITLRDCAGTDCAESTQNRRKTDANAPPACPWMHAYGPHPPTKVGLRVDQRHDARPACQQGLHPPPGELAAHDHDTGPAAGLTAPARAPVGRGAGHARPAGRECAAGIMQGLGPRVERGEARSTTVMSMQLHALCTARWRAPGRPSASTHGA